MSIIKSRHAEIEIKGGESQWIEKVALIHFNSLPNDFLPSLGFDFLKNTYYPYAFNSQLATMQIAFINGTPVGFMTIAYDSEKFMKNFIQDHFWEISLCALKNIFNNGKKIFVFVKIFLNSFFEKPEQVKSEIVFIAVEEKYRGLGIGKKLIQKGCKLVEQKGYERLRIKTLKTNRNWIAMFKGLGWKIDREFRLIGNEYVYLIGKTNLMSSIQK